MFAPIGETARMDTHPAASISELADALGAVRAEIRTLKAREAALRQALIEACPNRPVAGRHYEVSLRVSTRRVLARDRLPVAILGDERFSTISRTRAVVTRSLPPDAGLASTRPPGASQASFDFADAAREEELILVEEF